MRRMGPVGALVLPLTLLAAGCGGGAGARSSSGAGGTGGGAQATAAYARAVNVQPGDVPGMRAEGHEEPTRPSEQIVVPFLCGGSIVTQPTTIHSARFTSYAPASVREQRLVGRDYLPQISVRSSVYLAASASAAALAVAADRVRQVQECVARYPLTAGGERGPLVHPRVSVATLALTTPPGGFSFGATERGLYERAQPSAGPSARERAVDRFHLHFRSLTTDFLGFAYGRAQVTLFVFHWSGQAQRGLERRLLARLYLRARTHSP